MSFIQNNENFIRIELHSKTKGKSEIERIEIFNSLSFDLNSRLKTSYHSCDDKITFYKEALEVLGVFDAENVMLNLFLEDDFVKITDALVSDELFKKVTVNISNKESLSYYLHCFIANKSSFTKSCLYEFLHDSTIEWIESINRVDWNTHNENSNPLVNKFSSFFVNSDFSNEGLMINCYFIFTKIWNADRNFSIPFNNTKGILFFNTLNHYCDKNPYTDLYKFYNQLSDLTNRLFVNVEYFPIVDFKSKEEYSEGYLIKRKKFRIHMNSEKERNEVSLKMSYMQLAELLSMDKNDSLNEICEHVILQKLSSFEYPNSEELQRFRDSEIILDETKKMVLNKFYYF